MIPRPDQEIAVAKARAAMAEHGSALLALPTGFGKCLGIGTPVMLFDGRIVPVESVPVGALLMGPDSRPRTVLSLARGRDELFRISPRNGDPYVANRAHVLSLRMTGGSMRSCGAPDWSVVNIPISEYLQQTKSFRHCAKGWRAPAVDFADHDQPLRIDPYFLGMWLGDGDKYKPCITTGDQEIKDFLFQYAVRLGLYIRVEPNSPGSESVHITTHVQGGRYNSNPLTLALRQYRVFGNKHIPHRYLTASRDDRLKLLAGVIDSDGHRISRGGFEITLKSERLMDGVLFVARSLGFSAYKKSVTKTCCNNGISGSYWRCCINGPVDTVPCLVERKKAPPRRQIKNHLVHGINVDAIGEGDYFGFEIDGPDHLFLLGDFTVTHNTACAAFIIGEEAAADPRTRFMVVQHRDELLSQNCAAITSITGLPSSIVKAERNDWSGRVIFSSSPTLARANRRESMVPVSHIVVDEAHHIESESYQNILAHARSLYPGLKLLGLSATPERGDGKGLRRTFPGGVAYSKSIGDVIADGVLVPPRALTIDLADDELQDIDVDGGDYDMAQADEVLNHAVHNDAAVEHWLIHAAGRRSIFFCTTIDHAGAVAEAFRNAGIRAELISAETPTKQRHELIRSFDAGEIDILTNCMLLTEGFDSQPVSCVGILRPMLHRSTFIQAVGRGLRRVDPERYPGIVKTDCVVLDFAGAASRHGSLDAMLGLHDGHKAPARAGELGGGAEEEEDDEGPIVLRHIGLTAIELLGRSPFAWEAVLGDQSRRIASGFDAWAGVIGSNSDDTWIAVGKTRGGTLRTLHVGAEPQAISAADDFLRLNETSDAAKKSKRWLRDMATPKQIELLRSQGVAADYITKYEANCLLSWCWNKNAIQRALARACK